MSSVPISWLYSCNKSSNIRFVYSQYHVDLLKCTQQNVINQSLTPVSQFYVHVSFCLKGIVHLNIIFLYMNFNQICNLDHPVYQNNLSWFTATCISEHFVLYIIIHMGYYHLHPEKNCLNFLKMAAWKALCTIL